MSFYNVLHGVNTVQYFSPETDPMIDFEKVDLTALSMLEQARKLAEIPFRISSHYRTPEHSIKVGGFANDPHTKIPCTAFDIAYETSGDLYFIINGLIQAQFRRIGINPKNFHVHADNEINDSHFPYPRLWIEK